MRNLARLYFSLENSEDITRGIYGNIAKTFRLTTGKAYTQEQIEKAVMGRPEKVEQLKKITRIIATPGGIVPPKQQEEVLKSGKYVELYKGFDLTQFLVPVNGKFKLRPMAFTKEAIYREAQANLEKIQGKQSPQDKPVIYVMAEEDEYSCLATPKGLREYATRKLGKDCSKVNLETILEALEDQEIRVYAEIPAERKFRKNLIDDSKPDNFMNFRDIITEYLSNISGVSYFRPDLIAEDAGTPWDAFELGYEYADVISKVNLYKDYGMGALVVVGNDAVNGFYETAEELEDKFLIPAVKYLMCVHS